MDGALSSAPEDLMDDCRGFFLWGFWPDLFRSRQSFVFALNNQNTFFFQMEGKYVVCVLPPIVIFCVLSHCATLRKRALISVLISPRSLTCNKTLFAYCNAYARPETRASFNLRRFCDSANCCCLCCRSTAILLQIFLWKRITKKKLHPILGKWGKESRRNRENVFEWKWTRGKKIHQVMMMGE